MYSTLRTKRNDTLNAQAYALGEAYGAGDLQGYHGGCQCHRGRSCSEWTKQGLYTPKKARRAAAHFFQARAADHYDRIPLSEVEAAGLRRIFLRGFADGLARRSRRNPNRADLGRPRGR
jgi:hypothetical protein